MFHCTLFFLQLGQLHLSGPMVSSGDAHTLSPLGESLSLNRGGAVLSVSVSETAGITLTWLHGLGAARANRWWHAFKSGFQLSGFSSPFSPNIDFCYCEGRFYQTSQYLESFFIGQWHLLTLSGLSTEVTFLCLGWAGGTGKLHSWQKPSAGLPFIRKDHRPSLHTEGLVFPVP